MFRILKSFNRTLSTVKNMNPPLIVIPTNKQKKHKKHKWDIENESWTKPKKKKVFTYSYIRYIADLTERKKK